MRALCDAATDTFKSIFTERGAFQLEIRDFNCRADSVEYCLFLNTVANGRLWREGLGVTWGIGNSLQVTILSMAIYIGPQLVKDGLVKIGDKVE